MCTAAYAANDSIASKFSCGGKDISLGMTKEAVEKACGSPQQMDYDHDHGQKTLETEYYQMSKGSQVKVELKYDASGKLSKIETTVSSMKM
jgi:hypothetical protein